MIQVISEKNSLNFDSLIEAMHRDRKRIFIDMLRWNIPHEGDSERDQFDHVDAKYLILSDQLDNDHLASMRLLQTDRPHLMSEIFAHLCANGVPCGPDILEITRFCVAPKGRAADRRLARNKIVRAMVEYGLLTGIRAFTAVCDMGFLSEVLSAGWRCRPLGLPQLIDGKLTGALMIEIDGQTIGSLTGSWSCDPIELHLAEAASTSPLETIH